MSVANSGNRKRTRSELEEDEDTNINEAQPSPKKIKLDPAEIIANFIHIDNTVDFQTINLVIDIIKKGAVSTELINSYFRVQNTFHRPYKTLLAKIIQIIYDKSDRKNDQILLLSLKNLLSLILENGANPMLKQRRLFWTDSNDTKYVINRSLPTSTSIFHKASCKQMKDIKFDLCLFSNYNISDLNVSILNIAADDNRSNPFYRWFGRKSIIDDENDTAFYFSDHIAQHMITTEFTLDIGIKALCWYNLVTFYKKTSSEYDYQDVIGIIKDKSEMIKALNMNMRTINNKEKEIKTPIWLIHLFILKEYYKIYPIEFEKCFHQIPMDIINILKDYCIPKNDYSFLDVIDNEECEHETRIDEQQWILRCLENIHLLGQDWKAIFYEIMMKNKKYRPYLLDFSVKNKYKDIYSSIYELIWNDMQIIEKISNNPGQLMHFVARTMEFGHKELLTKFLKVIGKTYEFDYNSFIGTVEENEFDWNDILNFCIMEYKYDRIRHSMFVEICDYINKFCDNDNNVMLNVMDKLWIKREWINNTKWTKNKLQCLKVLKKKMGFDLNKSLKHCYLRQNGKYKITSIKLVTYILKYERNTLLNYQICKERNYLRNIGHCLNNTHPISNKMMKIIEELSVSFKQWQIENK